MSIIRRAVLAGEMWMGVVVVWRVRVGVGGWGGVWVWVWVVLVEGVEEVVEVVVGGGRVRSKPVCEEWSQKF